jgi:two-component system sensor histidine kinase EvgS
MYDDNSLLHPALAGVIDFKVLSSCVADKAGQIDILQSFHAENIHDIDTLNAALAQGDADAAAQTAHRMKGVSRMVGAHELQGICYQIETAAKQRDLQAAKESHSLLGDAMLRVERMIASLIIS